MSVFSMEESKANGNIPENCRNIIKKSADEGMFDFEKIFKGESGDWVTFYFLMTQDCNGKCPYCYQPKEFRQKETSISQKIIDDTMSFVASNFREDRVKFSLFGGEPLMNFDMIKYIVDTYPMFRYIITTNGLLINSNKEIYDWLISKRKSVMVSVSANAQKFVSGKEKFLDNLKPCIEVIKNNGGDIHYVIDNPREEGIFEEIVSLLSENIVVRISSTRHYEKLNDTEGYINIFKKIADYVYFGDKPKFGQVQWDNFINTNIYRRKKGLSLKSVPPTFCGCGYLYLAINKDGDVYPCDFFANFKEFKLGSIYSGFNETTMFFKKMKDWLEDLYEECKKCTVVPDGDIRLCPRAMCLAENYIISGNPLKPAPKHCLANKIEYALYDYISTKAIELKIDDLMSIDRLGWTQC